MPTAVARLSLHAAAAEPTTFLKTDDYIIAKNLWWGMQPCTVASKWHAHWLLSINYASCPTSLPTCRLSLPAPCPPWNRRFHVQRFFAVLDAADVDKYSTRSPDVPFSHNIAVGKLPLTNTSLHFHNIQAGVLRGTCLWVDFPFPAFPENMGHWAEALLPIYSALTDSTWVATAGLAPEAAHLSSVIFPNLRREQVQVRSLQPMAQSGGVLRLRPILLAGRERLLAPDRPRLIRPPAAFRALPAVAYFALWLWRRHHSSVASARIQPSAPIPPHTGPDLGHGHAASRAAPRPQVAPCPAPGAVLRRTGEPERHQLAGL